MKLRIRGSSIRLRLLQSEVAALATSGRCEESITFGPTESESLIYAIQVSETASEVSAGFCRNEICVILPISVAKAWIDSEEVGIHTSLDTGETHLDILVEKDFVCLTRTDDPDKEDAYPNPDAEC